MNRTPVHVAKQWTPVDFVVCVAEGVALGTSVSSDERHRLESDQTCSNTSN